MNDRARLHAIAWGRVQGVSFRYFVRVKARQLGLTGYVRNLPSGRGVEVVAEGEKRALEELLMAISQGPPEAVVDQVEVEWSDYSAGYPSFRVQF